MREPVLVIMAAGMGSRYGGLKQIDPLNAQGDIIIDFSIYDAMRAGFKKVIFIIKRELEKDFKERVGDKVSRYMEVEYVFQEVTIPGYGSSSFYSYAEDAAITTASLTTVMTAAAFSLSYCLCAAAAAIACAADSAATPCREKSLSRQSSRAGGFSPVHCCVNVLAAGA